MLYNYSYNVEVVIIDYTDPGAVPGTSTINTYAGYVDSILRHKKRQVCVYDGGELGSTVI